MLPAIDFSALPPFTFFALIAAIVLLLWDTVEVGRNDAANIVNSVFGSRVLTRRLAIFIAGIGVILGAYLSSDVIETARKGIFTPSSFTIEQCLSIYVSVYIVDTILLYSYSAFGMPVSTTMTLVFELLGASFFLGLTLNNQDTINWSNAQKVIFGIVCSIILSGVLGFFLQRASRGAIRNKWNKLNTLLLHGGWVGGGLMAGLCYFMFVKGMKNVSFVKDFQSSVLNEYGVFLTIVAFWLIFSVIIHILLVVFRKRAANLLFPVLTVIGMLAMAFAFGQNDLANCASPGLAAIKLVEGQQQGMTVFDINKIPIADGWLLLCGFLLVIGMSTKNAERVTKSEVRAGSRSESHVKLYAPRWCIWLASKINIYKNNNSIAALSSTSKPEEGITKHYDPLRACVIVCVSASVIATASGLGLPVSTTYVAFAAVLATGFADRIYVHGEADLKLGRSIWVIFSWFAAAVIASLAAGLVCVSIYYLGITGMIICLCLNFVVRFFVKKHADLQEARLREEEQKLLATT